MKLHSCIKYKVGCGCSIFTWHDNWHEDSPLVKRFGQRVIYDVASVSSSKLSDYIVDGRWNFPRPTSTFLNRVVSKLPGLHVNMEDMVVWVPSSNGNFSSASAKDTIRRHGNRVLWYKVIWFKGHVPRLAAIL